MTAINNLSYSINVGGNDLSNLYYIDLPNYSRYLEDMFHYSETPWYRRCIMTKPHLLQDTYNPHSITEFLPTDIVSGVYQNDRLKLRLVIRSGTLAVSITPKLGIIVRVDISYSDSFRIYTQLVTSSFTT